MTINKMPSVKVEIPHGWLISLIDETNKKPPEIIAVTKNEQIADSFMKWYKKKYHL
jgi:hypothetical protein